MSSFSDQLQAGKNAHIAIQALDSAARQQVNAVIAAWEAGEVDDRSVHLKIEAVVKNSYRSAGAVAVQVTISQANIPNWKPTLITQSTYLKALNFDVRKNIRDYKNSDKGEAVRRRLLMRLEYSAQVGTQRGYTDSLISSYGELKSFGYNLRKVWLNTLDGHTPCVFCAALHGVEVNLNDDYSDGGKLKVYINLQGPPRHPRCQCYLVILTVALENAFDKLDVGKPSVTPSMLSTDSIKAMPKAIFISVVKTLQKILKNIRGRNTP